MISIKKAVASAAAVGMAAGMIALAPVASADNYAPQLPNNRVTAGDSQRVVIRGAQPDCRVTFSIRNPGGPDNVNSGLESRVRTQVNQLGTARALLRWPQVTGLFQLITRIDGLGCTPTKSVQRIIVQ